MTKLLLNKGSLGYIFVLLLRFVWSEKDNPTQYQKASFTEAFLFVDCIYENNYANNNCI